METIKLRDDYIKLGQALKAAGLVENGVDAKFAVLDITFVDFLARNIMPEIELPIGLIITLIGVPFFIFVSRKKTAEDAY